jgi:hypothetical protein
VARPLLESVMTRRHDQGYRRPTIPDDLGQPDSVHGAWHPNVSEHGSNIVSTFENADGLIRIGSRKGFKTRVFNHLQCVHTHERFVLYHQQRGQQRW